MKPTPNPELSQRRHRLAQDVEAFLSSGNQIQHIPRGVSGERSITQPHRRRKGGRPKSIVISQKDSRVS